MNTLSKFHVDINKIRKVIGRKGNKLMPQKYETSFYLHINFSLTLNAFFSKPRFPILQKCSYTPQMSNHCEIWQVRAQQTSSFVELELSKNIETFLFYAQKTAEMFSKKLNFPFDRLLFLYFSIFLLDSSSTYTQCCTK